MLPHQGGAFGGPQPQFKPRYWGTRQGIPSRTVFPKSKLPPQPTEKEILGRDNSSTRQQRPQSAMDHKRSAAAASPASKSQRPGSALSVVYTVDDESIQRATESLKPGAQAGFEKYSSPMTRDLEVPPVSVSTPHSHGEVALTPGHKPLNKPASFTLHSDAQLKRENSGRILRTESWKRQHESADGDASDGLPSRPLSVRGPTESRAAQLASIASAANDESSLRLSRRRSLKKLLAMPADEIQALGDVGEVITKVTDDDYDLEADIPGSPSSFRADSMYGTAMAAAEQLVSSDSFTSIRVGRMRPQRVPKERQMAVLDPVDPSLLPQFDTEEDQRAAVLPPPDLLVHYLRKALSTVEDINAEEVASATTEDLRQRALQAVQVNRAIAHSTIAHVEQLVDGPVVTVLSALQERVQSLERQLAAEKAANDQQSRELNTLRARMREMGMVPTFRGIVAPDADEVTVVIWDIPDAQQLWREDTQSTRAALTTVDQINRSLLAEYHGYESIFVGNACQAAFDDAKKALDYCLRLQKQLVGASWPEELLKRPETTPDSKMMWRGLRARMAVHTGPAEIVVDSESQRTSYFGDATNVASAMMQRTHPGTIAVSSETLGSIPQHATLATHGGAARAPLAMINTPAGPVHGVLMVPMSLVGRFEQLEGVTPRPSPWLLSTGRPIDVDPVNRRDHRTLNEEVTIQQTTLNAKLDGLDELSADVRTPSFEDSSLVRGHNTATVIGVGVEHLDKLFDIDVHLALEVSSTFKRAVAQSIGITRGLPVHCLGGSTLCVFATRSEAIAFMTALDTFLLSQRWSAKILALEWFQEVNRQGAKVFCGPRLKMGMAYGAVDLLMEDDGIAASGKVVDLALTLASHAIGGEAIATADVTGGESTRAGLASHITSTSIGKHRLGGHHSEVELYQLIPNSSLPRKDLIVHSMRESYRATNAELWPIGQLQERVKEAKESTISRKNALEKHANLITGDMKPPAGIDPPSVATASFVSVEAPISAETWDAATVPLLEAVRSFARVVRLLTVELQDGYECGSTADSFLLAFQNPANALKFCIMCQEKLAVTYWNPALANLAATQRVVTADDALVFNGLRARMGIMTGEGSGATIAEVESLSGFTRYYGAVIRQLVALTALGSPGEILADERTVSLARPQLRALGEPAVNPSGSALLPQSTTASTIFTIVPHTSRLREFPAVSARNTILDWLALRSDAEDTKYILAKESKLRAPMHLRTAIEQVMRTNTPSRTTTPAASALEKSLDSPGRALFDLEASESATKFDEALRGLLQTSRDLLLQPFSNFAADTQEALRDKIEAVLDADASFRQGLSPIELPTVASIWELGMGTPTGEGSRGSFVRRKSSLKRRKSGMLARSSSDLGSDGGVERTKREIVKLHRLVRKALSMEREYLGVVTGETKTKEFFSEEAYVKRFVAFCKEADVVATDDNRALTAEKYFAALSLSASEREPSDGSKTKLAVLTRSLAGHFAKFHHTLSKLSRRTGSVSGGNSVTSMPMRRQSLANMALERSDSLNNPPTPQSRAALSPQQSSRKGSSRRPSGQHVAFVSPTSPPSPPEFELGAKAVESSGDDDDDPVEAEEVRSALSSFRAFGDST